MDNIEKLHLEAIDLECTTVQNVTVGKEEAATKSAEITKQIAIEFLRYFQQTVELGFCSTGENIGKDDEEVFEEFIKQYEKNSN